MIFNIFIQTKLRTFNILNVDEEALKIIVSAFQQGHETFTLKGEKYFIKDLYKLKIFTFEAHTSLGEFLNYLSSYIGNKYYNGKYKYFTTVGLKKGGRNVTAEYLGNEEFGSRSRSESKSKTFVSQIRINELKMLKSDKYDLTKLIKLIDELNDNFGRDNYLSVGMILRSILDHIPPILGYEYFKDVANQYPGKSFKSIARHLQDSSRNISDKFLHQSIREKETLPTSSQIDFSQSLDVILEEIVRILK